MAGLNWNLFNYRQPAPQEPTGIVTPQLVAVAVGCVAILGTAAWFGYRRVRRWISQPQETSPQEPSTRTRPAIPNEVIKAVTTVSSKIYAALHRKKPALPQKISQEPATNAVTQKAVATKTTTVAKKITQNLPPAPPSLEHQAQKTSSVDPDVVVAMINALSTRIMADPSSYKFKGAFSTESEKANVDKTEKQLFEGLENSFSTETEEVTCLRSRIKDLSENFYSDKLLLTSLLKRLVRTSGLPKEELTARCRDFSLLFSLVASYNCSHEEQLDMDAALFPK